jgi:hypothetical protein
MDLGHVMLGGLAALGLVSTLGGLAYGRAGESAARVEMLAWRDKMLEATEERDECLKQNARFRQALQIPKIDMSPPPGAQCFAQDPTGRCTHWGYSPR